MLVLVIIPSCHVIASVPAHLTYRSHVTVNDSIIRLSDIAAVSCDDARVRRKLANLRVGETAPPGFSRYVLVASLKPRLFAHHVPGVTVSSDGPQRVKVTTAHKSIQLKDLEPEIHKHIRNRLHWNPSQCSIHVFDTDREIKVLDMPHRLKIQGCENPYAKGTVRLRVIVSQGTLVRDESVVCKVRVNAPVVVTTERITRESELGHSNCVIREMDITNYRYKVFTSLKDLEGVLTRRTLSPGTIVHEKQVKTPPLVRKGDEVFVTLRTGAVIVSVAARARENGGLGERIWLENLQTHQLIRGTVRGKGKVAFPTERISL